jgi:tetratricopeptide (TPR) repeat protein
MTSCTSHLVSAFAARRSGRASSTTLAIVLLGTSLASFPNRAIVAQVADTASARAEALFAAKDYLGAASAFQALTRTHPQQPRYWTRLGTSLQLAGRPDDAVSAYRHAIGITTAPIAMYNLATVFATRGQKDSAFYWLDQLVTNAAYSNDKAVSADSDFASLRTDPRFNSLLERMRAVMRPCLTRKESRLFDFWVGEWNVKNPQGQPAGQSSVQLLLEGCALYENWTDGQGGGGKSLNSYNTDINQWQQFWTDQYGRVTEYRESEWVNGSLRYTAHQLKPQERLLHMTFTPINPDLVRQFGEMSADGGKTWTPTFDLYYHRKK